NRYSYDPWGNVLEETEADGARQPFRFASAEYEAHTKLYKMGARYYDPTLGRFTQLDLLDSGYTYVFNNPVNFVDPSGYDPLEAPDFDGPIVMSFSRAAANFFRGIGEGESLREDVPLRRLLDLDGEVQPPIVYAAGPLGTVTSRQLYKP